MSGTNDHCKDEAAGFTSGRTQNSRGRVFRVLKFLPRCLGYGQNIDFFQSFVPAVVIFELLLSCSVLRIGQLMMISVISMCLAFSALYKLIEWLSAVILGQGADAFLGTQGDPWDTQWDMFMALVGATLATLWQHCRCLKLSVPK